MLSKACLSAALLAITSLAQRAPPSTDASKPEITPEWAGPRRAYCHMLYDGVYPTTYPYGRFYLYQANPSAPVQIKGKMKQMPPPSSKHGFAINEKHYQWNTIPRACKTAGGHWNPFSETHGEMNNMTYPSHVGNLLPVKDDSAGNALYYTSAERPTMYGS